MKLYTEEQMIDAIASARFYTELIIPNNILLKKYTPIELPSDEEIEEESCYIAEFRAGAKWMREQILNQNNNNERTITDNDRVC